MSSQEIAALKDCITLSQVIQQTYALTPSGNEFIALCPFHSEKTPSFRINDEKGFYYCFGCNAHGDVFDWLMKARGMSWPDAIAHVGHLPLNATPRSRDAKQPIPAMVPIPPEAGTPPFDSGYSATYAYRNAEGGALFYIARYEGKPKWFIPCYYGHDGNWQKKIFPGVRPLYGLQKLALCNVVLLVEGEKCCDIAQPYLQQDMALITWSGGAGAIDKTDFTPLEDKVVIYWPDTGKAGEETIPKLKRILPHIKVLTIPEGKVPGWDIADAIQEDKFTTEDIKNFIKENINRPDDLPIKKPFPKHLLQNVPGVVGQVFDFINDTSSKPQPILALGAAISFVGSLYGHRIQTKTNLRTNMYIMGIAPSGSGKEHARTCIKEILYACDLEDYLAGEPLSKSAIHTTLAINKGCKIMLIDEMGRFLQVINSKYAGGHQKQIIDALMKIYTQSHTIYYGEEYANRDGKSPRIDINQPCLSLYATTVMDNLTPALTSKEAIDGFLARWLLFESDCPYPEDVTPKKYVKNIPLEIVDAISEIIRKPTDAYPNLLPSEKIYPYIVPFTPEAEHHKRNYEVMIRKYVLSGQRIAQLWVRAAAHADKIALCASDGIQITGGVMEWAIQVTTFCIEQMEAMVWEHIADNEAEVLTKRVLRIIQQNRRGLTTNELYKQTRWLTKRQRDEILEHLLHEGSVAYEETKASHKTKRKAITYYPVWE